MNEMKDAIYDSSREGQIPTKFLDLKEVIEALKKINVNRAIFMGAEPTIDPELSRLAKILYREFHTYNVLLTNGFNRPPLENIDEVVFSIKAYTDSIHRHYTGRSNKKALENFANILRAGIKLRSESILIPHYIDYQEIENIAKFISEADPGIPYRIDPYLPVLDNPWRQPTQKELDRAVFGAKKYLTSVSCLKAHTQLLYDVIRII